MGWPPRFYLESLGCAKNQVDSEQMIAALLRAGYRHTKNADDADLIVVNSCGFIRPAKTESIETTLELKALHPDARVILAGCLTERYETELRNELPEIDGFAGNRDPEAVVAVARELLPTSAPPRATGRPTRRRRVLLSYPGSVYVKIAEGCDNRCTYCAIPLIRGALHSRPSADILAEIRTFVARGIREINLVAQDVGSYGRDLGETGIVDLIDRIMGIPGDYWLRLLYIHPDHVPEGLASIARGDRRMVPYFDLPFQHASPAILRAMGRRGDATVYLDLVRSIREVVPDAVIRSTFLTGFPGETEADFAVLRDFQDRSRLDWVGVFAYSREEGTPAAELPGHQRSGVAERRRREIETAQIPITEQALDRHVGSVLDVLVEERILGERMLLGRSYVQAPEVDGSIVVNAPPGPIPRPGDVVATRITRRNGFDLEGWVT